MVWRGSVAEETGYVCCRLLVVLHEQIRIGLKIVLCSKI